MTPLLDTDLLRVNRGGVDYQATWLEVKAGVPGGPPPEYDPDAQDYITRVEAADTQPLEDAVKDAINQLVLDLKAIGAFSKASACCLFTGPRTLAGALESLIPGAPVATVTNGVSPDYNRIRYRKEAGDLLLSNVSPVTWSGSEPPDLTIASWPDQTAWNFGFSGASTSFAKNDCQPLAHETGWWYIRLYGQVNDFQRWDEVVGPGFLAFGRVGQSVRYIDLRYPTTQERLPVVVTANPITAPVYWGSRGTGNAGINQFRLWWMSTYHDLAELRTQFETYVNAIDAALSP